MTVKRATVFILGIVVGLSVPTGAAVRETSDKDIDRAIEAVKGYLWAQQNEGGDWQKPLYEYHNRLPSHFMDAICVFALLEAGESHRQNPRMAKALEVLAKMDLNDLRVVALRSMALGRVVAEDKKSPYRKRLIDDLQWMVRGKGFFGSWGPSGPEKTGDNMCNQFALWAYWESTQAGLQLKLALFEMAQKVLVQRQHKDGGWSFANVGSVDIEPDVRMTAAALSSLYICWDALTKTSGPFPQHKTMEAGWAYIDKNFQPDFILNNYSALCVQQLGMLSGRKFMGGHDWYAIAAEKLAEPRPSGSAYDIGDWGPIVRAAFELLLMARGRIPLTFNKLNYGETTTWNYHSRDIARFTDYMRLNYERPMRWQVVEIAYDIKAMLDAPILFLEGENPLELTKEQWARLREYTLRGGTLLFVPSRNSRPFADSVKEGLKTLYDEQRQQAGRHYELQQLPADDPLYSCQQQIPSGNTAMPVWTIGDGSRPLAILCERDIAGAWQRKAHTTMKRDFDMGVNLFMYTTGKNALSSRLRPVFTSSAKREIRHTVKVAWLKHGGNWNTQPFALDYLSEKLADENRVAIKITKGCPISSEAIAGQHLLWMTGTDRFQLTQAEIDALKHYLGAGGMLFINAVGGDRNFDNSARRLLLQLRDDLKLSDGDADLECPLFTGVSGDFRGPKIKSFDEIDRTVALRQAVPQRTDPLYIYHRGDNILIVHAKYGVHDTLDGHTAYAAKSYMPDTARNLAANIVLYALAGKPQPKAKPGEKAKPDEESEPAEEMNPVVK